MSMETSLTMQQLNDSLVSSNFDNIELNAKPNSTTLDMPLNDSHNHASMKDS